MNHYIKLPNGRYLVLAYDENELSIASSFDGKTVHAYICSIGGSGTMVLPNSSDAGEAFHGLKPNGEEAPEYSHSLWE